MSGFKIPFLRPPLSQNDIDTTIRVMKGSNISTGKEREQFENEFKQYINCNYSLAVANGTIALELVWETLILNGKLYKNDTVITPSFTFVATANSLIKQKLNPLFVDIDPNTWNLLPTENDFKKADAVLCVHCFGNPADLEYITEMCEKYDVLLIEDAAEACGARYKNQKCGSFGWASIFSFNATKNMTTGEGGMACFRDKDDAETALLLCENGFGYGARNASIPGHNYRLSNIQCAIGISQLKTLEERNQMRRVNAYCLAATMEYCGLEGKVRPQLLSSGNRGAYQIFGILVENRDKVYDHMVKNGIEVKKYFSPPVHEQEWYHNNFMFPEFPVTDYVSNKILTLPFDDKLDGESIAYMVEKLAEVV